MIQPTAKSSTTDIKVKTDSIEKYDNSKSSSDRVFVDKSKPEVDMYKKNELRRLDIEGSKDNKDNQASQDNQASHQTADQTPLAIESGIKVFNIRNKEDVPMNLAKDFAIFMGYLAILVLLFCVLSFVVLLLNIDFTQVYSDRQIHTYVVCYLINGFVTLDLVNLVRLQMRYRLTKHVTGQSVDPFTSTTSQALTSTGCSFVRIVAGTMLVTDVGVGSLLRLSVYASQMTQITFLLVVVGLNVVKVGQLLLGVWIWKMIDKKIARPEQLDEFNKEAPKRIYVFYLLLSVMKILPFCQLVCSFIGEEIAPYLPDVRLMLIFCIIYPLIMGFWQKLMSIIDKKAELDIEFIGESYSLMYAVLPYKMVYLSIDPPEVVGMVLGIKIVYKTIAYLIIPGYTTLKQYRLNKRKERQSNISNTTTVPKRGNKKSTTIIQVKRLLSQFFDDPAKGKKLFMNKFLVLQSSDIFVNICVVVLLLVDKYVLNRLGGYGMDRETSFIEQFATFSGIELGIDVFILIVYGLVLRKMLFSGKYNFSSRFKRFYLNLASHIVLAGAILFFLCYYIRYSIKFTA